MVTRAEHDIAAVVFDVGETLIDESRAWGRWADWLGMSRLTLFAVLGATIARGEPHRRVFEILAPGFDPWAELERRRAAGEDDGEPDERDLYPDVVEGLAALREAGYRLGVAGNQFAHSETWLARLRPPLDLIGSSESWGVEKPAAAFFERLAAELDLPPARIAYVGDRLDNDVRAAGAAGCLGIHLRRGPWGWIQAEERAVTDGPSINGLLELPSLLARVDAAGR